MYIYYKHVLFFQYKNNLQFLPVFYYRHFILLWGNAADSNRIFVLLRKFTNRTPECI